MHRLQISIPEWQYRFLQEQASRTGQSIAGLIRKLIEREAQTVQRPVEEDPVGEMVGIGQNGPPHDISERADEFLDDRWRRAIAAAGRFHSGVSDISTKHDEYLAVAFQE